MRATINGVERDVEDGTTVAVLLRELGVSQNGHAVAVNDHVVRKGALAEMTLAEGDAVEIIRAVAGG